MTASLPIEWTQTQLAQAVVSQLELLTSRLSICAVTKLPARKHCCAGGTRVSACYRLASSYPWRNRPA